MLVNWHHELIIKTLLDVYNGKIKRLIINIPPGYSKTQFTVIYFIAWCLAMNPLSRFLHLSYSSSLALENSSKTRSIIKSSAYQDMWPLQIKDDSDSKAMWWTEQGGGVYATSTGGQVTGFRAGHMDKSKFTGAMIIDDPNKPADAYTVEREKVNTNFNETLKSRLAHEDVRIILIMQRIHDNDLSGYLLKGGSGQKWHHLMLPVKADETDVYNDKYTHSIPIKTPKYNWLWDYKHCDDNINELQSHKRNYWSQYKQMPERVSVEDALWQAELIDRYRVNILPENIDKIVVGVDPSGDDGKDDSKSDEIGIIVVAKTKDKHYYLIDDGSMNGSPKSWASKCVQLYNKHTGNMIVGEKNYGGAMVEATIRSVDGGQHVRYTNVTATRGKLVRAEPVAALYEQGLVHHVGNFFQLENEMTTYNGKGSSPNRLDALVWAISYLSKSFNYGSINYGN